MTGLLTPAEVAAAFGVRDPRTVRRRLQELGVATVPFGRSFRVRAIDLERAVAVAAVVPAGTTRTTAVGVALAPGARLWDSPSVSKSVGPRRANGRPRGTREQTPVQEKPTNGSPALSGSLSRAFEHEETP